MPSLDEFVLTLDVDWAPDPIIDEVAQILIDKQVRATWFVTHRSEAVERLQDHKHLFELGIHPNMLAGSTHGGSEERVLSHVKELVPGAVSMRTHGLYQSSGWLIQAARDHGVLIDVSLLLPRASHLQPHRFTWCDTSLWRVPYFWEDDVEMFDADPIWTASDERLKVHGLRVLDFHPVHIALNTGRFEDYNRLKATRPLPDWDEDFIAEHAREGSGPRSMFLELANCLEGRGRQIRELVATEGNESSDHRPNPDPV